MPIYQLKCQHCDFEKEVLCKYDDIKEQQCEVCDSGMEQRYTANLSGTVGAVINGVGVYKHGTY